MTIMDKFEVMTLDDTDKIGYRFVSGPYADIVVHFKNIELKPNENDNSVSDLTYDFDTFSEAQFEIDDAFNKEVDDLIKVLVTQVLTAQAETTVEQDSTPAAG